MRPDPDRELSFQAVVENWLPTIQNALLFYHVSGHDKEDLTQTILCDIFEKRYDQIYDPSLSKLTTFIFAMVRKRVMSFKSCRGRDAMRHSQLVGEELWLLDEPDNRDDIASREFWQLVDNIHESLSKIIRRRASKQGAQVVKYTVGDIFNLLVGGLTQAQIHRETGYSEASISLFIKGIRKRDDVLRLKSYWTNVEEKELV